MKGKENFPNEFKNCHVCKHNINNSGCELSFGYCQSESHFLPDWDKICKWCYSPVADGDNICAAHRESHKKHSWPGCMENTERVAKEELKQRRERIATALMANLMRGDMTDCDMRDYVKLSIQGTDALIKALDEVKE